LFESNFYINATGLLPTRLKRLELVFDFEMILEIQVCHFSRATFTPKDYRAELIVQYTTFICELVV
jgi:hypothetical protein